MGKFFGLFIKFNVYYINIKMFEKLEELAKNNKKISDFHIRSGWPLAYRQTGEIHKIPEVQVKAQDLQDLISTNCNEVEMKKISGYS